MAYASTKARTNKKVSTNPFDAIMDELDNDEFKYDSNHTLNHNGKKAVDKNKKTKKKDNKYTSNSKQHKPVHSVFSKHPNKSSKKKKKGNTISTAWNKAKQRGQKLFELQDKSEQMKETAMEYNSLSKQLADKSWFG